MQGSSGQGPEWSQHSPSQTASTRLLSETNACYQIQTACCISPNTCRLNVCSLTILSKGLLCMCSQRHIFAHTTKNENIEGPIFSDSDYLCRGLHPDHYVILVQRLCAEDLCWGNRTGWRRSKCNANAAQLILSGLCRQREPSAQRKPCNTESLLIRQWFISEKNK